MEIIVILAKIVLGGYFILSGVMHFVKKTDMEGYAQSKGLAVPSASVGFSGVALVLGGLSIIFNLFMIIGGWMIVLFLILAAFMMHDFWKAKDAGTKMAEMIHFQKNLALAAALILIMHM